MTIEQAQELSKAIDFLDGVNQSPKSGDGELTIGKNDPKSGQDDYWWCSYGKVHLSGYYSFAQMLIDLVKEIKVKNEA
jgi:hypothetical protein